jgi:hypothetical protein
VEDAYVDLVAKVVKAIHDFLEEGFTPPTQRWHVFEQYLIGLKALDSMKES